MRYRLDRTAFRRGKHNRLLLAPRRQARVYEHGTNNLATGYTTEGGSTPVTYPLEANRNGRYDAWYEFRALDVVDVPSGVRSVWVPPIGGSLAGTVDTVTSKVQVEPVADDENAVTVKAPTLAWGGSTIAYGKGQAFMYLREDYVGAPGGGATTEPDRNVMYRVDRWGGVGYAGGVHLATGLRMPDRSPQPTQSIWVDPAIDVAGVVIDAANDAPTTDYLLARTNSGTIKARIAAGGQVVANADAGYVSIGNIANFSSIQLGPGDGNQVILYKSAANVMSVATGDAFVTQDTDIVAQNNATTRRVAIGNVFGSPGIIFGDATDAFIARTADGVLLVDDSFVFIERADPAAPAVNRGHLYTRDNGSGKTQLCVRFNTGAVQVLATEP